MLCRSAITDKILSFSPDEEVETALKAMKKAKASLAAVVDGQGSIIGVFSYRALLENLLPVSVVVNDGLQLDVQLGAAPGMAKRLKKLFPLRVSDLMERKFTAISADTPLWEGVHVLVQTGAPILLVDGLDNKPIGLMTHESAFEQLNSAKDSES